MAKSTKVQSTKVRNLVVSIPLYFASFLPHYLFISNLFPIFATKYWLTVLIGPLVSTSLQRLSGGTSMIFEG